MGGTIYNIKYNKIKEEVLSLIENGFFQDLEVLNHYNKSFELKSRNDALLLRLLNK